MAKVYGYCRISTQKQSIERQERNIRAAYPDAVIMKEVYTGTTTAGREIFEKLNKRAAAGDTIVFDSVSRMSRNAAEGFENYQRFYEAGVNLVFLKEPHINTETYRQAMNNQISTAIDSGDSATNELIQGITEAINRYTMRLAERQIMLAFEQAEKEVQDLRQRTREGIQTAREHGKQIGAVSGKPRTVKKEAPAKEVIRKHSKDFGGMLTDSEVIKLSGLSRNTYYKYKRELKNEA